MLPSNLPAWLRSLHHDGSEKYVVNPTPRLGETLRIRLRADISAPIRRVLLRTFPDGEQMLTPMWKGMAQPPTQFWEADLSINQPNVHYRFLIQADDGVYWYTAAGVLNYEPLDATEPGYGSCSARYWKPHGILL